MSNSSGTDRVPRAAFAWSKAGRGALVVRAGIAMLAGAILLLPAACTGSGERPAAGAALDSGDADTQAMIAKLPPGRRLLPEDSLAAFALAGAAEQATLTRIPVKGEKFAQALRIEVTAKPSKPIEVAAPNVADVRKGDAVLVLYWAGRTDSDTGQAHLDFTFAAGGEASLKPLVFATTADPKWERHSVAFVAPQDIPAGQACIAFRLSSGPQRVEIAAVSAVNYGTSVPFEDLHKIATAYPGQSPDAAWRKAALRRIDQIRKATWP